MNSLRFASLLLAALLAGCAAPVPATPAVAIARAEGAAPDLHVPDYAKRPFEPFARANAVGIALREWRAFGSVVNNEKPDPLVVQPDELRPDKQPGLWQRVGDYWWSGQDAGSQAAGWTSKYNEWGRQYGFGGSPAWSAAFISYVMRTAGAGDRFIYSTLHSDYINAAAQGMWAAAAEPPETYAPQLGDLICTGRERSENIRFSALPTSRFTSHCDIVVEVQPGQLSVVGGNVAGGVTMKHVPTTPEGLLVGPEGYPVDTRYNWFVTLRVAYDA